MCSTPKPKRKAKVTSSSTGILSSISNEKRREFALRANQASVRRIEIEKLERVKNKRLNKLIFKSNTKKKAKTVSSWLYPILNTSVSDVANKIASKLLRSIT